MVTYQAKLQSVWPIKSHCHRAAFSGMASSGRHSLRAGGFRIWQFGATSFCISILLDHALRSCNKSGVVDSGEANSGTSTSGTGIPVVKPELSLDVSSSVLICLIVSKLRAVVRIEAEQSSISAIAESSAACTYMSVHCNF